MAQTKRFPIGIGPRSSEVDLRTDLIQGRFGFTLLGCPESDQEGIIEIILKVRDTFTQLAGLRVARLGSSTLLDRLCV